MGEPNQIIEQQLEVTNSTLRKVNKLMRNMEPLFHDLKNGKLKRVEKRTFTRKEKGLRKLDFTTNSRSASSSVDSDADKMDPPHQSASPKKSPRM